MSLDPDGHEHVFGGDYFIRQKPTGSQRLVRQLEAPGHPARPHAQQRARGARCMSRRDRQAQRRTRIRRRPATTRSARSQTAGGDSAKGLTAPDTSLLVLTHPDGARGVIPRPARSTTPIPWRRALTRRPLRWRSARRRRSVRRCDGPATQQRCRRRHGERRTPRGPVDRSSGGQTR